LLFLQELIRIVERISQAPFLFAAFETFEQAEKIQTPCNSSGHMLNPEKIKTILTL
jgi:hypothetical protein